MFLATLVLFGCGDGGSSPAFTTTRSNGTLASETPAASVPSPAATTPPSTLESSTDWPTFAHDLSRSSLQPLSAGISPSNIGQMQLLWSYRSAAGYDLASPIEYAGIVYAVDEQGNMVALSESTGAVVWQRSFGVEVKMTPSIYDGHLFVGTFIGSPKKNSTLYSLDLATGATIWQAAVPGGIHGSPIALNGMLYVPLSLGDPGFCNPGGVYGFDETMGTSGLNWLVGGKAVAANGGAVWSPLSYDGSRILYGTGNTCITSPETANAVVALSPSFQLEWTDRTADPMSDDDVGSGVVESGGTAYVTGKTGIMYAVDAATGASRWQVNLGVPDLFGSYSTPELAANTLITSIGYRYDPYLTQPAGTQYGGLDGLDPATGSLRWQISAVSPFYNPPALVAGMAITTIDSAVAAIDPATGTTLWSTPINGYSRSGVMVANGVIVSADADGFLYAYALPTAANATIRERAKRSIRIVPSEPHFVNRIPRFCKLKN